MTRTVEDSAILLQVVSGYDPGDPGSVDLPVPYFKAQLGEPLMGLRIGVARSWYEDTVTDEMAAAISAMLDVIRELGAQVFDIQVSEIADMNACGRIILLSEGYAIRKATLTSRPEDYGRFTRDRMRLGGFISAAQYLQAQRMRRDLVNHTMMAMRGCDVLVTASHYGPADLFTACTDTFPFFGKPYLTMPFGVTGQPAMSVPCGYAGNGLPLGFQIAGRPFDEVTVFRVGHAYEQARGRLDQRPPI